jgi:N-acetylglucosaminyldiphosphoundecaprenol N-acetyl-beta-D-mannosaminyltransferase
MSEQVILGQVPCDFMDQREFVAICQLWLASQAFHHVVTLNPEMVILADRDAAFREAVAQADARVPDGAGLVWARWYLRSSFWPLWPSLFAFLFQPAERVTGVDLVMTLGRLCHERGASLYLLGGKPAEREHTAQLLASTFAGLTVQQSPAHTFSESGPAEIVADIQAKQPAVVLVAYGAPKQTIWIEQQREKLPSVRIAVGVGGAFAMLSEKLPRAPLFLRRANLEWMWRLYLEPGRLPRILQATIQFPLRMHQQKAAVKK